MRSPHLFAFTTVTQSPPLLVAGLIINVDENRYSACAFLIQAKIGCGDCSRGA
jgi:hypothetical protein